MLSQREHCFWGGVVGKPEIISFQPVTMEWVSNQSFSSPSSSVHLTKGYFQDRETERPEECKCPPSPVFCKFSSRIKKQQMCLNPSKKAVLDSKAWDTLKCNSGELSSAHTLTESCHFSLTCHINSEQELDWHRLEKQQVLKKRLGGQTSSLSETMKYFSNPSGHSL